MATLRRRISARRVCAATGSLALIAAGVWLLAVAWDRSVFEANRLDDPESAAAALTHESPKVRAFARAELRALLQAQPGRPPPFQYSLAGRGRGAMLMSASSLAQAAVGEDPESADLAREWLRELGVDVAPRLGEMLESQKWPAARMAAGCSLLLLGQDAAPAMGALVATAAAEADPVHGIALESLCRIHGIDFGAIGPPAHTSFASALRAAGQDRRVALDLLQSLAEQADPLVRDHPGVALPALLGAVPIGKDRPEGALAGIARRLSAASQGPLAAALSHEDAAVRANAARLLAEGAPVSSTTERLLAAQGDPDETVRGWVRLALAQALTWPPGTALAQGLADASPWVREASARAAGHGPLEAQLLPGLVAALADREPGVRRAAAPALARFAEFPESSKREVGAVVDRFQEPLAAALRDESAAVRAQAARALSWNGAGAARQSAALLAALRDRDESVRVAAARALEAAGELTGDAFETVLRASADASDGSRSSLVRAAHAVGRRDPGLPAALLRFLEYRSPATRAAAADALVASGTGALAALRPALAAAVNADRREVLLGILARIGPDAGPALPEILAAMQDADGSTREAAVRAAGALGDRGADAAPALLGLIRNGDFAAPAAGLALGAILPGADSLLPECLEMLRTLSNPAAKKALRTALAGAPDRSVPAVARWLEGNEAARQEAFATLAAIGRASRAAEPLLLGALADPDPRVRADFARVVAGCWDGDRQLGALRRLATMAESDPVVEVRVAALETSLDVVPHDADRDERLMRLAADPEARIRRVAVGGLGRAGTPAAAAALVDALRDPVAEVALAARSALTIGSLDLTRRPLLKMLEDPSPRLRTEAAELLARDAKSLAVVAEALAGLLKPGTDPEPRRRAAAVFAHEPALVRHALPALRAAREDADEEVRRVAGEALAKHEGR